MTTRLSCILLTLTLAPGLAFGQDSFHIQTTKTAFTSAPVVVKDKSPQRPIQFVGFDGSTYVYRSNCCDTSDLHYGLIYSATELQTGCNQDGVDGDLSIDAQPDSGGGNKLELTLMGKNNLGNNVASFKFANWLNTDDPYRDYYGANRDMTAIHLKAQDNTSKYFTLTSSRIKYAGTDYKVPMLILSRGGFNFSRQQGMGIPVSINPTKKLDPNGQQIQGMANWNSPGVYKVTVKLPKSSNDNKLEDVECILVLRP